MFGDPVTNTKELPIANLPELGENLDNKRVPITGGDRKAGKYPYYGASGIVDYVADYIFDDDLLLISEDGANLIARVTPIAFPSAGKVWINNHAHVIKFKSMAMQCYVENLLNMIDISPYVTGTAQPKLNQAKLNTIPIPIPEETQIREYLDFVRQSDKSKFARLKSQFIEMFYGKGYPVKTIGDVIDKNIIRVGKVFKKTDSIQYLDISSIDNTSKTVIGLTPYALADAPSRAQYVMKQNDIMYSTVRPNLQNIAINPYSDENVVGSTGFCVLRCIGVTTGYMWGVINSIPFTEAMVNQASGANYPAVTDKVVHAYEIPIPPENEQNAYDELVRQSDKSKLCFWPCDTATLHRVHS